MRIATFNLENLFDRPKMLNLNDVAKTSELLAKLDALQKELKRKVYRVEEIGDLYKELKSYVLIRVDSGRLFNSKTGKVAAKGPEDWSGAIELKRSEFDEGQRQGTATAIKALAADILCTVEVEGREAMTDFGQTYLPGKHRFPQNMLIDSPRDPRGIDVGLQWKVGTLGRIRSYAYARDSILGKEAWVFSRDCLDVELLRDGAKPLYLLCNHFKSKMNGDPPSSKARREAQARYVANLAAGFDLKKDHVVICGDLNDTPDSSALAPLLSVSGLHDVFDLGQVKQEERFTYVFGKEHNQIDYILVSTALKARFQGVWVERRGMSAAADGKLPDVQPFPGMSSWKDAASDHAAIVADFDI